MLTITIISIVVVALLTAVIFGLTWLAYSSCIKAYRMEVRQGKHDKKIKDEYLFKKKKRKGGLFGLIGSCLVLSALLGTFVTGLVYKVNGEQLTFNNKTVLVIKSGSMSDFFDDNIAEEYNFNKSLQFDIGDICVFEKVSPDAELVEGEVYGYKSRKNIITHRLVGVEDSLYRFRGDNNPISDILLVQRENILYHYIGKKIPGIGSFILYAQSIFGIWSLLGMAGVAISSEIVYTRLDKINKARVKELTDYEE